jgi:hypothetical protein
LYKAQPHNLPKRWPFVARITSKKFESKLFNKTASATDTAGATGAAGAAGAVLLCSASLANASFGGNVSVTSESTILYNLHTTCKLKRCPIIIDKFNATAVAINVRVLASKRYQMEESSNNICNTCHGKGKKKKKTVNAPFQTKRESVFCTYMTASVVAA